MEAIIADNLIMSLYSLLAEQNTKYNSVTGPLLHLDLPSISVLPENGKSKLQYDNLS